MQLEREDAALSAADWEQFRLIFAGDVDAVLTQRSVETRRLLRSLEGEPVASVPQPVTDPNTPLVGDQDDLSMYPLNVLERELERLRKLVGMDAQNTRFWRKKHPTFHARAPKA